MIDPYDYAVAQEMSWVKLLLDNMELIIMEELYGDMLWYSYAPDLKGSKIIYIVVILLIP